MRYKIINPFTSICCNCGMLEHYTPVIKITEDERLCFKCHKEIYGPVDPDTQKKYNLIKNEKLLQYYKDKVVEIKKRIRDRK